jgi:hypothetical protein
MNTRTLLGATAALAALAGAAVPASAQTTSRFFFSTAPFTFNFSDAAAATYSATDVPVSFLTTGGATSTGTLSLSGSGFESGSHFVYDNTTLTFTPTGGTAITETGMSSLQTYMGNQYQISSIGPFSGGDQFILTNGSPVPEASTVVSTGALLALGGLAFLRRRAVKRAS